MKVFLSYRREPPDQDVATELRDCFVSNGLEVFLDTDIETGEEWSGRIDEELRSSQFFVVLLSQRSYRRPMVQHEVRIAYRRREMNALRILPVRLGFDGELSYELGAFLDPIQQSYWRPGESVQALAHHLLQVMGASKPSIVPAAVEPLIPAPFAETGSMSAESPLYIRRAVEDQIEPVLRTASGRTVVISGPRQIGKSSLLVRLIDLAARQGFRTCLIDFQSLDDSRIRDLHSTLRTLASRLARQLGSAVKPGDVWDEDLGHKESFAEFLQLALSEQPAPLLLCLDEVDRMFHTTFRSEFFSGVRAWHNYRASKPQFRKLYLVLAHATKPDPWIDDPGQSPFNVGHRFSLDDFGPVEIARLNDAFGNPVQVPELDELAGWTGGQPFLTAHCLYLLKSQATTLENLKAQSVRADGLFADHLNYLRGRVLASKDAATSLRQVLASGRCDSEPAFHWLLALGLIRGASRSAATMRCRLYDNYFREHL